MFKFSHRILKLRNNVRETAMFNYIIKYNNKLKSIELPDKLKGTIVEKWISYWKDVFRDYKDVFKEFSGELKSKPWKGIAFLLASSSSVYVAKHNPDESHFRNSILGYCNQIVLVGPAIRNPLAIKHLNFVEQCYNEGILRRFSFGLFSVIWADNYNEYLNIYKAMCPYLKPEYMKFHNRIIDIGFCDKWWLLEKNLLHYDVNPEEWINKSPN